MPHKMPAQSEDDKKLFARLKKHPKFFARVEGLLAIVENAGGDINKASAAEALVILEVRKMGHESLSSWALNQVEKVSEAACENPKLRHAGKKKLAGTPPSGPLK